MAFRNRIRLPFHVTRPQFPTQRKVFPLANGETKTTSVIIKKVYDGVVDYLPEKMHERLIIALSHDIKNLESSEYIGGIYLDAEYEINWEEFLNYPIAQARFKAGVTPYNFSNFNCQTCEEATQLNLADDTITGIYDSIDEGDTVQYNVFANDSICCSPVTAQIMTTDADFVESASIDPLTGIVTIELKSTTPSGTNVNLLTYRVTCPNGQYDEADVFANVAGSVATCPAPDFVDAGTITETGATPNWDWILGAPPEVDSFNYALYEASNPGVPIDSGNTSSFSVNYTTLTPGTCYIFAVQTVCDDSSVSDFITVNFCTPISASNCGRYNVTKIDGTAPPGAGPYTYQYINCSGAYVDGFIMNYQTLLVCMLESSPGVPVFIVNVTSYEYVEPC